MLQMWLKNNGLKVCFSGRVPDRADIDWTHCFSLSSVPLRSLLSFSSLAFASQRRENTFEHQGRK